MALNPEHLALLACPVCKGDLVYDSGAQTLTCGTCRRRYRIVDEVPNMLVDQAEKI